MMLGRVIGHATATVKHPSMNGLRLLIVQTLNPRREPDGDAVVAVDRLGSAVGHVVVLNSDGKAARELVGHDKSPIRYFVIGIADE